MHTKNILHIRFISLLTIKALIKSLKSWNNVMQYVMEFKSELLVAKNQGKVLV